MDIARKIREIRKARKMNQAEFAELVGTGQGMISKWESGKDKPSFNNLQRLAAAFPPEEAYLFTAGVEHIYQEQGGDRETTVIGAVQAGVWIEAIEWDAEDQFTVSAPLPGTWISLKTLGFLVRGNSMDRLYPDGSIVIVAPTIINRIDPGSGDRVIVQQQAPDGRYEVCLKELIRDDMGRFWLWPRSSDPEHQVPLLVDAPPEGSDTPEPLITGIVVASFRIENEGRF